MSTYVCACMRTHVFVYVCACHACASVSMSVWYIEIREQEGTAGPVEGESQRSEACASQEKMKFKEKITALGDSVHLTCF